jgi:HSP20 family molecular chaperone IbpA
MSFSVPERLEKRFERRSVLPPEADLDHVKATFDKGVLEVHVPKLEPALARKIEIAKA